MPDTPLTQLHRAAEWLRARHQWLDRLVTRIAGDTDDWLHEVAGAILDTVDNGEAWERYERQHPEPPDRDDESAYYRWEEAGPKNTDRGSAFAVMSGGEVRVVRLIATLANVRGLDAMCQRRVPRTAHDVGGWDERGQAIFTDWLEILRVQGT